jgi:hypothetical protein
MDDTEGEASSSNLPAMEPLHVGSFGIPGVTSRPPSRAVTRPGMPTELQTDPGPAGIGLAGHPLSSQATPNAGTLEAILQSQEEELSILRNGQSSAAHIISLLMQFTKRITSDLAQSRNDMMLHMSEQSEIIRVHLDDQMLSFAQAVEAPVQQAMHASTTAAGMATELAGRYVGLQADVERTFNAATATHKALEIAAAEALRQSQEDFQQARTNLDAATVSMTQVRHENASSMAQTEALTAQLAQTRLLERAPQRANVEAGLPTTTTPPVSSDLGTMLFLVHH